MTFQELVPVSLKTKKFTMEGMFSRPVPAVTAHSIQAKKVLLTCEESLLFQGEKIFMLFVNGRAVESTRFRTAFNFVFSAMQLHYHFLMVSIWV